MHPVPKPSETHFKLDSSLGIKGKTEIHTTEIKKLMKATGQHLRQHGMYTKSTRESQNAQRQAQ